MYLFQRWHLTIALVVTSLLAVFMTAGPFSLPTYPLGVWVEHIRTIDEPTPATHPPLRPDWATNWDDMHQGNEMAPVVVEPVVQSNATDTDDFPPQEVSFTLRPNWPTATKLEVALPEGQYDLVGHTRPVLKWSSGEDYPGATCRVTRHGGYHYLEIRVNPDSLPGTGICLLVFNRRLEQIPIDISYFTELPVEYGR